MFEGRERIRMARKIAMSTIRGMSVKDSIDVAVRSGCTGIEIQTDYLPEDVHAYDSVFGYARQRGLEISLHAPCGDINITALNRGIRKESIAQIKNAIDLAGYYRARAVTVHPGRLSSARENIDEKWKVLLHAVQEIADYAVSEKVSVGIENMEYRKKEMVFSIEDLNRFVSVGENNPYFGVTLDFSHFATNKISLNEIKKMCLPIKNVHISQCVAGKPHLPMDADGGEVQTAEVLSILNALGYQDAIVMELKSIADWEVFEKSRVYLELCE